MKVEVVKKVGASFESLFTEREKNMAKRVLQMNQPEYFSINERENKMGIF